MKSDLPFFFKGKSVSPSRGNGASLKCPLYFEQYGNLCLYASYHTADKTPLDKVLPSAFHMTLLSHVVPIKRTRLLIPRDALSFEQYRTLQSFAARQVRLKTDKSYH